MRPVSNTRILQMAQGLLGAPPSRGMTLWNGMCRWKDDTREAPASHSKSACNFAPLGAEKRLLHCKEQKKLQTAAPLGTLEPCIQRQPPAATAPFKNAWHSARPSPRKLRQKPPRIENTIPQQSTAVIAAAKAMHPARSAGRVGWVRRHQSPFTHRSGHGAVTHRLSFNWNAEPVET